MPSNSADFIQNICVCRKHQRKWNTDKQPIR